MRRRAANREQPAPGRPGRSTSQHPLRRAVPAGRQPGLAAPGGHSTGCGSSPRLTRPAPRGAE
eukprot:9179736-Alexandrium_andersonii.AAC.1